jgi:cytochrome c nitrite reductase small subunit
MDAVYEGWYHGMHKNWANCNDCHTPHALIPKYWVKAQSGYHHVTAFIFGNIPDAIRAKEASQNVVQENCIRCHTETVANLMGEMAAEADAEADAGAYAGAGEHTGFDRYCFECHRTVAHGERGISLLPYQHSEENR